nr:PREDICTED: coiled-coil domain-containing protein KIAA1407 homolog [Latimeria chalumnae]|eukprot:XP_014343250.1 PREDICTED: coiled-coil domain-containing protein KIAA1407 homolog [Latimeria chalumnae]
MLTARKGMASSGSNSHLFSWKRFTKVNKEASKVRSDCDDVEHWIKRVEQASEFAVSEAFALKKWSGSGWARGQAMALETVDQLHDHDEAYAEAQELLNNWANSKLRLEFEEEGDLENSGKLEEGPPPKSDTALAFPKYEKFNDLYSYLEQEVESTTVASFLQELLHKEVVDSGILEDLGMNEDREKKPKKDPQVVMEMRHQQVKENRLKRQAELERERQEKALKKSARAEAQRLLLDEEKKKAAKARQEEEKIQREVVRLRKDMAGKRCIMEQAKKIERDKQEQEETWRMMALNQSQQAMWEAELRKQRERERREMERHLKLQALQARINMEMMRCLQKHFSAWYKLVVERRLKLGKARALSDWKSQLSTFRAWRSYVWYRRAKRESQQTEMELQEQNRKDQLAIECARRRVLRHCFTGWRSWCRAEQEKRELEAKKEETRKKMAALLDAASAGRLGTIQSTGSVRDREIRTQDARIETSKRTVDGMFESGEKRPASLSGNRLIARSNHPPQLSPQKPQYAWQVTRQHAALSAGDLAKIRGGAWDSPDSPPIRQVLPSDAPWRKTPSPAGDSSHTFAHRQTFQRQLIEEQRRQLSEQRQVILELQENQRLMMLKGEAERATATTAEITNLIQKTGAGKGGSAERRTVAEHKLNPDDKVLSIRLPAPPRGQEGSEEETRKALSSSQRTNSQLNTPHPIVRAMEDRAAQRAERRKELEEKKRKREEEKLAHLKAEEEARQRKEEAEKQLVLERKREERRLQRQRETEKQLRLERQWHLQAQAEDHYRRVLLRQRGLEPWKRLMEQSRSNTQLNACPPLC